MEMGRLKQAFDVTQQRKKLAGLIEEMTRVIDDLDRRWTLIGISRQSKGAQEGKRTSRQL